MFAIPRARLRSTFMSSADTPRVIRDIAADKKVNTNPAELTCTYRCLRNTYARVYRKSNTMRFNGETANTIVTKVFGKIWTCTRFFFSYSSLNTTCQTCSTGSLQSPSCARHVFVLHRMFVPHPHPYVPLTSFFLDFYVQRDISTHPGDERKILTNRGMRTC